MPTGVIRLSPSGPPITNNTGGEAVPGDGFQLRLAERAGSTAMAALTDAYQDITDIGGQPFQVLLLEPDPNRKYKFNFHCDVDQVTGADSTVQFQVLASYDGGATFPNVLGENTHQLLSNSERRAGIDIPMQLGSALGFPVTTPIPAGAPSIIVKVQAKAGTTGTVQIPNGGDSGTIWLSLAELL